MLSKAGFNSKASLFLSNYLIGRKTQYLCNDFISSFFDVDIGVKQGFAFFFLFFHIFEKRLKNLNISVSSLFFVDNELLILQEKSLEKTNAFLFCSYNIILSLLNQFGLVIKYRKSKVFHFSKSHRLFNLSSLNLSPLRKPTSHLKDSWRYLGFIFNRKLSFQQHINFYSNKVLFTIKCIKILGNSTRGLLSHQKQLLYLLKELRKIQYRAVL